MEAHLINIIRFMICLLSLITAIIAMFKADDNNAMRRLSAVLAAIIIYFNQQIGSMTYLTVVTSIEAAVTTAGLGFILTLLLTVMFLPFIIVIFKLIHG